MFYKRWRRRWWSGEIDFTTFPLLVPANDSDEPNWIISDDSDADLPFCSPTTQHCEIDLINFLSTLHSCENFSLIFDFFLFVFSLYFNSIPKLGDLLPPMMESVYNLYRRSASAGLITKTSTSHNINTRREERREEKNVFLRWCWRAWPNFPSWKSFLFSQIVFFSFSSTRQPHSFWMVFTVFTLFQSRLFLYARGCCHSTSADFYLLLWWWWWWLEGVTRFSLLC